MKRANRKMLNEAIREQQENASLSAEVEWTMESIRFLRQYHGDHPILKALASKAKRNPNWVPTERQVIQVHRIAHRERLEPQRQERDALGRRLRKREQLDIPDSLAEPDWL